MPLHPKIEEAERELSKAITKLEDMSAYGSNDEMLAAAIYVLVLESKAEESHRIYGTH